LKAIYKTDTLRKTIEVKKPGKLGNSHGTAYDVKLKTFDLDSLIIYYAGQEGVLPQYIKAIISVETMGFFDPCYRYELWGDIDVLQVKNRAGKCIYESDTSYSHYRILSSSDKGTPDIPIDHSNVRDASKTRRPYPSYTTIWDYYWNHTDFYTLNIYPGGTKERYWDNTCDTASIELYNKSYDELTASEQEVVEDTTNARFFRWVRYSYEGGMENMVAQTRIYASYGLLQLVYYGGKEYPKNNSSYRPEDINDHSIGFQYGVKHFVNNFNHFADPTWQEGLEEKYKQAVRLYNGSGSRAIKYANDVISQVPKFLPKR
jgi:hypothetical protein